ncbi:hypothetical protein CIWKM_02_00150 [Citrobacter werkmanii NBRC 105721]|nr:hypothetical protein CIWKM_02_00150 [Citrobacter werkmanii NBRC 105721]
MLSQRKVPFTSCSSLFCTLNASERVKGAIAAPLTIPAPGGKIAAPRFPPLIPPGYRGGRDVTSL